MQKKTAPESGKKEKIVSAALELFFENGYEGTSMRMIAEKAGCSAGLAYNYFKTKDEVFEKAMDLWFLNYEKNFENIVEGAKRNPFQTLNIFFEYLRKETEIFLSKYYGKLHWTVSYAIRERALSVIEPYLREIVNVLVSWGAKPRLGLDAVVIMLTHGIGSMILHSDFDIYARNHDDMFKAANLIMGIDEQQSGIMTPRPAQQDDAEMCVALAKSEENTMSDFKDDVFKEIIKKRIARGEVLVISLGSSVVGMILFSKKRCEIDLITVMEKYRHKGVGMRLLVTALSYLPVGSTASVTVCRDDNPLGADAVSFFRRYGFETSERCYAFGQPVQRLIRVVPDKATLIAEQKHID